MTTVYVIRRTDKEDPTDTALVFGAPGDMGSGYPSASTFITSDFRVAEEYQHEFTSVSLFRDNVYTIEEREVQV
jgi:hypothetical protein